MAAQPYTYDPATGRYHDGAGRRVPADFVPRALERVVARTQARLAVLGQQRAAGGNTADWRLAVQAELRQAHLTAAALAQGGLDQLDARTRGFVGSRLRAQYDYLSGLALDTRPGAFDGRAMARLAQYGDGAVRGTFYEVVRRGAAARSATEERNVLGGSARPCDECPEWSARGWVPLGTLPPIGGRQCAGNCHCSIITRVGATAGIA